MSAPLSSLIKVKKSIIFIHMRTFVLLSSWLWTDKQLEKNMGGIRNSQNCARCRNHGVKNILRGHKKHCAFKNCNCDKCLATKDRQSFIAKEIAMHRYETKNQSVISENVEKGLKLNLSLVHSRSMEDAANFEEIWSVKSPTKLNKSNGEVRKEQQCSRCRNHGKVRTKNYFSNMLFLGRLEG